MRLARTTWIVLFAFLVAGSAQAASPDGLRKAWADPTAVRSTFFIEGMSCRACTMMLDLNLNRTPGILWARFNYPLRLLTAYHDPKKVSSDTIVASVAKAKELKAVFLESRPAARFKPGPKGSLAAWKGGTVGAKEATAILKPFETSLREQLGDSAERSQVEYEILGEVVRNRILLGFARKAGYTGKGQPGALPEVVAKDFYWPEKLLPLTSDEASLAAFLNGEVLMAKAEEQRRKDFDAWLLRLWRKIDIDFRGEVAEP